MKISFILLVLVSLPISSLAQSLTQTQQQKLAQWCKLTVSDLEFNYFLCNGRPCDDELQSLSYYPFKIVSLNKDGALIKGVIRNDYKVTNDNGGWTDATFEEYSIHYECAWDDLKKDEYRRANAVVKYPSKDSNGDLYGKFDNPMLTFVELNPDDIRAKYWWKKIQYTSEGDIWEPNPLFGERESLVDYSFIKRYQIEGPKDYWTWK